MKLNVLVTGPALDKEGGVASYLSGLLGALDCKPQYFTLGKRSTEGAQGWLLTRMIKDYLNFYKTLGEQQWDLVHLNPSIISNSLIRDALFLLLARLKKKKTILFFHGWVPEFAAKTGRFPWFFFRRMLMKADAAIVLAGQFKAELIGWGFKGPIFLESTLIDNQYLIPADIVHSRNEKKPDAAGPSVLFLSRLESTKGLFETIDACLLLKADFPDLKLVIAGTGSAKDSAQNYCADKNWVVFKGFLGGEDKKKAFLEADLYLLPSYFEGMPISVLEAMAFGIPVITRSVGGLADFFDGDKMGGLTVSKDPRVLAKLCSQVLSDPSKWQKISKYNVEYARKNFSSAEVGRRIDTIYCETAG